MLDRGKKRLAPSILSADFSQLAAQVEIIEKGGADLIHVDVMDGHYVPNISYGPVVMKSLLGKTNLPFDVHLMIEDPDRYIGDFATENTEYITVHKEASRHLDRTIDLIHSFGLKAGLALNPASPVSDIELVLAKLDMVLIMSVNPGFGGQSFIPYSLDKIKQLDAIRKERGLSFAIEVDGGVDEDNLIDILGAGADIIVVGSKIFGSQNILETTQRFASLLGEKES